MPDPHPDTTDAGDYAAGLAAARTALERSSARQADPEDQEHPETTGDHAA